MSGRERRIGAGSILRHYSIIFAAVLTLTLGACGVKGPPEPPPDADPEDIRVPGSSAPPPDGEAPEDPFILDGLLI